MSAQQGGQHLSLQAIEEEPATTDPLVLSAHPPADLTLREGVRRLRAEPLPEDGISSTLARVDIPSGTANTRNARAASRHRLFARLSVCAAALLVIAGLQGARWVERDPDVQVLRQVLPAVNAFDTWTRSEISPDAGRMARDAFKRIETTIGKIGSSELDVWKYLLYRNRNSLSRISAGLRQDFAWPRGRAESMDSGQASVIQDLASLLALRAEVRLLESRPKEALADALQLLAMGDHVARNAGAMGHIVGEMIVARGRSVAWRTVQTVDRKSAAAAAATLSQLVNGRVTLGSSLRQEMLSGQDRLLAFVRKDGWRSQMTSSFGLRPRPYFVTKVGLLQQYTDSMIRQIADAESYPAVRSNGAKPAWLDPEAQVFVQPYDGMIVADAESRAKTRILMTEFALRAYLLEHGAYPRALRDLAPKYLGRVPRDPFRPQEPLIYSRVARGYEIRSVGPDGAEQGLSGVQNVRASISDQDGSTLLGMVGDIVSGVDGK